MQTLKLTRKQAAPILKATFPEYTGRKIRLTYVQKLTFYDTNWGGGTRNQYKAMRLDNYKTASFDAPAPWMNPVEGKTIEMPDNGVIVCHSFYCGEDCGITIYANPTNALKLLQ